MTAGRVSNSCDGRPCSLSYRPPRISGSLFITTSMDDHNEEKRTEQNLFVRSGKSEAEVTNNRRLRSTYCTTELTTDRHEALRGLSARAGLLVVTSAKADIMRSGRFLCHSVCHSLCVRDYCKINRSVLLKLDVIEQMKNIDLQTL